MAEISSITLPSGQVFDLRDETAYRKPASGIPAADLAGGVALPAVSAADNGKILRVSGGAWTAEDLASANGVSF